MKAAIFAFVVFLIAVFLVTLNQPDPARSPAPPKSAETIAKERAEHEECQQKLTLGMAIGLVKNMEMRGRMPTVVVDERLWNGADFSTKTGLAETYDCAIAGPGMALSRAEFRSNMTDRVLARWNGVRLEVE